MEILFMEDGHPLDLLGQRTCQRSRQYRPAILPALAASDGDLQPVQIHVLHPKPQRLHQAQPRTVEQAGDQVVTALQMRKQPLNLGRPHVGRVALAMKENETSNPVDVLLLGANAVVLDPAALPHPVEQPRLSGLVHSPNPSLGYCKVSPCGPQQKQGVAAFKGSLSDGSVVWQHDVSGTEF